MAPQLSRPAARWVVLIAPSVYTAGTVTVVFIAPNPDGRFGSVIVPSVLVAALSALVVVYSNVHTSWKTSVSGILAATLISIVVIILSFNGTPSAVNFLTHMPSLACSIHVAILVIASVKSSEQRSASQRRDEVRPDERDLRQ